MRCAIASLVLYCVSCLAAAGELPVAKALGKCLEEVRAAKPTQPIESDCADADVQNELLGVQRSHLYSLMGKPDFCGTVMANQPCEKATLVSYLFYRFPEDTENRSWRGGGPELRVQFTRRHIVERVWWEHTR